MSHRRSTLDAFDRALARESHNLSRWPELTWQQLCNRLQWESVAPSIVLARAPRTGRAVRPWMRMRTPPRESHTLVRTLPRDGGAVYACCVAPDGSFLVSGGHGMVKVWNTETGAEIHRLLGHEGSVDACPVSPDGAYIVSGGSDGTVRLWDAKTGTPLGVFAGHDGPVTCCAVSPDGSYIVSTGGDGAVKLWDPVSGKLLKTLRGHRNNPVWACAVSADSQLILSAGQRMIGGYQRGLLQVWDRTGNKLLTIRHTHALTGCDLSPDARHIIAASSDGTVMMWDRTGAEVRAFTGHHDTVNACRFSPDGRQIVSASKDTTIRLWDPDSGSEIGSLTGHSKAVVACAIGCDGHFVISGGFDDTVKMWDVDRIAREGSSASSRYPSTCAMSPDGNFIVSADHELSRQDDDFTLTMWDVNSGSKLRTLNDHAGSVSSCVVSPNRRLIVTGGTRDDMATATLWDAETGTELGHLSSAGSSVHNSFHKCALSPDGRFIVTARADGTVTVWEMPGDPGDLVSLLHYKPVWAWSSPEGSIDDCAITPDGRYVVCVTATYSSKAFGYTSGTLSVWEPGAASSTLSIDEPLYACAVSPDQSYTVAVGGRGYESGTVGRAGIVKIWDAASGEQRPSLTFDGGPVTTCAVTPDARFIVTGGADSTIRVWHSVTGDEVITLPLLAQPTKLLTHPWLPWVVAVDGVTDPHLLALVEVEYGPIVITPVSQGDGVVVRCPKCWAAHPLNNEWLGQVIDCPTPACVLTLRVNPFISGGRWIRQSP